MICFACFHKLEDCGQSPVIPYGQSSPIDYRNTTYGASARVICQTGYESSVSIILCQSTGVWQAAVCRPKGKFIYKCAILTSGLFFC